MEGRAMEQPKLWQVSLPLAVSRGYVAPIVSVGQALQHGDTGIGTQAETGELVVFLDGVCHVPLEDGSVQPARRAAQLCQLSIAPFDHYAPVFLTGDLGRMADFVGVLEGRSEVSRGRNSFHLVVAAGTIERAVVSGTKAYQATEGLTERGKTSTTMLENVSGRIVGTRRPAYLEPSGRDCWRFVLLAEDGSSMGHLLGLSGASLACQICRYESAELRLPPARAFSRIDMGRRAGTY